MMPLPSQDFTIRTPERHVVKDMVISHHALRGVTGIAEVAALYEVDENLIIKEWLVYG